ncbi:MAG: glycosyltransferase family 61 protein [Novosphingobium sp.]
MRKALGARDDLLLHAAERWEIAPAGSVEVRPAKVLPGQLDRIRGAEFGTLAQVVRDFQGGYGAAQPPTMAYRFKDVELIDGVLYAAGSARHLRARQQRWPVGRLPAEPIRGSLYESWCGNRWFGNWLGDDCLAYRLAEDAGSPLATGTMSGHQSVYERKLGMRPVRVQAARFSELVLFEDRSHNQHKRERADDLRRRLIAGPVRRHPGVFMVRGQSGDPRVLLNEREISERLAATRGFTILDPTIATVDEIVDVCGGAEVVAGVEGSQLVHGLMLMPPTARALVIQPPARAVSVLKMFTDRQGQDFALVVGVGNNEAFRVDVGDIERTLDLA